MSDHQRIWLQPECCACPDTGRLWCKDPDPEDCEEGIPWTEYIRADIAEQREAELVELLRRARWALHVWESQDYDVQSRLSLQNEAADLRCEIASRLESYKAGGREG